MAITHLCARPSGVAHSARTAAWCDEERAQTDAYKQRRAKSGEQQRCSPTAPPPTSPSAVHSGRRRRMNASKSDGTGLLLTLIVHDPLSLRFHFRFVDASSRWTVSHAASAAAQQAAAYQLHESRAVRDGWRVLPGYGLDLRSVTPIVRLWRWIAHRGRARWLWAGDIPMARVKMNAKHEYEFIANFKILQNVFRQHKVEKVCDPPRRV